MRLAERNGGYIYKAGDPNTPVTGVACTFMATFDVLKRASKTGVCGKCNNVTIFNKKEKEAKRKKGLLLQNTTLKNEHFGLINREYPSADILPGCQLPIP